MNASYDYFRSGIPTEYPFFSDLQPTFVHEVNEASTPFEGYLCGFVFPWQREKMASDCETANNDTYWIVMPLWVPFVILAAYPTIALIRGLLRRRRRRKRGLCRSCGYDLTGLPEPKCPECGTAFDVQGGVLDGDVKR